MTDNHVAEVMRALGKLEGKVDGINERLDTLNGKVLKHAEKLAAHDIFIGKVGVVVTALAFTVTLIGNFIVTKLRVMFGDA